MSVILGLGRTKCHTLLQSISVTWLRQRTTDLRSGRYLVHYILKYHYLSRCEVNGAGVLTKILTVMCGRKRPDIPRTMGKTLLHNPIMPLSCVPRKNVIPLHTSRDYVVYGEQHYPSSAEQTWLSY